MSPVETAKEAFTDAAAAIRARQAPDPIHQPGGDAPPAPAQSAGAAADGEMNAAFLERMSVDFSRSGDERPELKDADRARLHALARRGAQPHDPAAPSPDQAEARGEVAEAVPTERDVLLFASYCGDDNPECSENRPCPRCLGMSNVYRARIGTYVRELSPDWLHDNDALARACDFTVPVLDRARPAGQGEGEPVADDLFVNFDAKALTKADADHELFSAAVRYARRRYEIEGYQVVPAPPAPASRATSTPAQEAGLAGVTEALINALIDMQAGWRYIREHHGDLYGVGWDRCEASASAALDAAARARRTPDAGQEVG